MYAGQLSWLGTYAVFGFYTLSGYLMTSVLHEAYGYAPNGVGRYLANRALRIYPAYWCALVIGVVVLVYLPQSGFTVQIPSTLDGWIRNIVLFGLHPWLTPRVVSPAWSLYVELCFYILIGLGVSRTRERCILWWAFSLAATGYLVYTEPRFGFRYGTLLASSLPFSTGSLMFFVGRSVTLPSWCGLVTAAAFIAHSFAARWIWADVQLQGFYASAGLAAVAVLALTRTDRVRIKRFDRLVGDLSYPLFLLHNSIGYLVGAAFWTGHSLGLPLLLATFIPANLAALAVHFGMIRPVEALRTRLRPQRATPPD